MQASRISALLLLCAMAGLAVCPPTLAQEPGAAPIALAARDLPRGVVLEPGDFVFEIESDSDGPIGWTTRRVVTEGEPLRPPTIAPVDVVRSGDTVQLVWRAGGLELRLSGRAMGSAAVGERVRVRVDSKRRFEGTVLETGVVRLDSPENGRQR